MQGYIRGIDGLRAIAVLSVIAYHLNSSFLPGGFTGVDVFFVISGYVVAKSLVHRDKEGLGQFLWDFYKRRFTRIYPALLLCLISCSLIVVLFVPRFYLSRDIDDTALSAFFGVSNIVLALSTDSYFSPSSDFNPFVHTWSLGVEEQFYLLFPFVMFYWVRGKFQNAIYILFALSFTLSIYHSLTNTNYAYYLLTSRLWELAAGAMLFKYHFSSRNNDKASVSIGVLSLVGAMALILGFIFADKARFPFPWAILPVLGTCLIIHSIVMANNGRSWVSALSMKPAVHFGKLSYSLYLWHWPVFVFFRWSIGLETALEYLYALVLTYLISLFSYSIVERRLTSAQWVRNSNSKLAVMVSIGLIVLSFEITSRGLAAQGWRSLSVTIDKDIWSPFTDIPQAGARDLPLSGRTLYVLGDSHASAYSKMLRQLTLDTGIRVEKMSRGGCGVMNLLKPVVKSGALCQEQMTLWLDQIKERANENDIIFLATLKTYRMVTQNSKYPSDREMQLLKLHSDERVKNRELALTESIDVLSELSRITDLIIIDAPKPIYNYIAFRCADWYTRDNPICQGGSVEKRDFIEQYRQPAMDSLKAIVQQFPTVQIWDPVPLLCSETECSLYVDGKPSIFDGDHLSGHGNELVYPDFKQQLLTLVNDSDTVQTAKISQKH